MKMDSIVYVEKILRVTEEQLSTAKLPQLLSLLYEDLNDIRYRIDLVNSRFYIGVCDSYFCDSLDINFLGFVIYEDTSNYHVNTYTTSVFPPTLFPQCGTGIFRKASTLILTYSKNVQKWGFYTTSSGIWRTHSNIEFFIDYDIPSEYNHFETVLYNHTLFSRFDDLLDFLILHYICPSCYYLSRLDRDIIDVSNHCKCLKFGASKYRDSPQSLEFICFFFIKHFWYHKRRIINYILPPGLYNLLNKKYQFFTPPRWPNYSLRTWDNKEFKDLY